MENGGTVMSPARRFTITLEVREPDGNLCFCDLTMENHIGSSSTTPDSFWMSLLRSLPEGKDPIILRPEEMDSSLWARLNGLEPSWKG